MFLVRSEIILIVKAKLCFIYIEKKKKIIYFDTFRRFNKSHLCRYH